MAMKKLWLISAVLLALVVEIAVAIPVRERVRRAYRNPCRYRPGCYSVISNREIDDQLELSSIPDLINFPTLAPALQNPSVEEFKTDLTNLQELLWRFKLELSATANTPEDGKDYRTI